MKEVIYLAANTTAVVKEVYPLVEKSLSRNGGVKKYKDCVQRHIEKNPAMFNSIPNNRLYYGKEEIDDFFNSMGLTPADITAGLSHAFYWNMNYSPISAKDPFTVTALMVVRYFLLKHDQKNAELAAIYLAFTGKIYPSMHWKSFNFLADDCDAVMTYVANTQMSNKFSIKTDGNIFNVVRKVANTWLSSYSSRIKRLTDDDVGYIIKQLINRISSFLKNFAKLYYDAYADKEYLNYSSDNLDDENFRIADTDVLRADRYTQAALTYITSHAVDYKICTMCADQNVKKDEVKEIMESILKNSSNLTLLKELIENIIADYMRNSDTKDVRDMSFITYSIAVKPNAKDKNIVRIKDIIYKFLEDNSANYRRRKNRVATQNSYYKAVLEYIVLVINRANT